MLLLLGVLVAACQRDPGLLGEPAPGARIALIGNNLCARMQYDGSFETELHQRYPAQKLLVRNLCDPGDTPGFRPHSGRYDAWAFPGAEEIYAGDQRANPSDPQGRFPYPDQWLDTVNADLVLAFFGYNESFDGAAGEERFRTELDSFVVHTLRQTYNESSPELVLVSPIPVQARAEILSEADATATNERLADYTEIMRDVAAARGVPLIDALGFAGETTDGLQLTRAGNDAFAAFLVDRLFGANGPETDRREDLRTAVLERNWMWHQDYKIPNGVHVYGRRHAPFGPDNYPMELEKIRQLTANRDAAIWATANGQTYDLAAADADTRSLPAVESNYDPGMGSETYRYGNDALRSFTVANGYRVELFASEEDWPDLANPVQISFDNRGRLWVATMPTYPHWKPGDAKPSDKLILLEDTDHDGRADRQTIFAENLHLPVGFELTHDGVIVSQGTNLKLLRDTDGDDRADTEEILLSGFDDHDTHHTTSAFCADPAGGIFMAEGIFLHSNVETPHGPVRATNGGFYRYEPRTRRLERTAQVPVPNPWGIAFDAWGQPFFLETSNTSVRWMSPSTILPRYGVGSPQGPDLIEESARVRPTSGLEFVHSRHFPDAVQGDMLFGNTIGFLGVKQHRMVESQSGYAPKFRQNLLQSDDPNFRPVDLEFAPDGSLYLVDWHNVLVGHMQHNARDPLRDHVHGRIYRITYPDRPLVKPATVADADLATLFANLKLPEYRTRYRTRRELRGRDADEVAAFAQNWTTELDTDDPNHEHHLLEALWVTQGAGRLDETLLKKLLASDDHRVRAAAVRALRYGLPPDQQADYLEPLATDPHGRVRTEVLAAASRLNSGRGVAILQTLQQGPLDDWTREPLRYALAHLNDQTIFNEEERLFPANLIGPDWQRFMAGQEIYMQDGYCVTCHQRNGQGVAASGYPPLARSEWVNDDKERLIKLTLHGLMGPIEVRGKTYPGQVPMTPYADLLDDEELAQVLTFVRNAFGNETSAVTAAEVAQVRAATADREGFYRAEELQ